MFLFSKFLKVLVRLKTELLPIGSEASKTRL